MILRLWVNYTKPSCPRSRTGLGYVMWQKRCRCTKIHSTCCSTGWVLIACGSRFCTAAEQNYHPIECKLLAVTWALQKTAFYTLGSEELLILVNHKPLLGLLKSRNIGEIENTRLLHLTEHLLTWKFYIQHIAGAKNFAPDALSRFPARPPQKGQLYKVSDEFSSELQTSPSTGHDELICNLNSLNSVKESVQTSSDQLEALVLATSATRRSLVVSWDDLKTAAISDEPYSEPLHALHSNTETWTESIAEYKKYRQDVTTVDGVILYKGRVVVPKVLRPQALQALHLTHQGETGMTLCTQEAIWWPNITSDITDTRARCGTCNRNAPTQLRLPPVHPPLPKYPFQMISSDYFHYEGHNYLLFVD